MNGWVIRIDNETHTKFLSKAIEIYRDRHKEFKNKENIPKWLIIREALTTYINKYGGELELWQ